MRRTTLKMVSFVPITVAPSQRFRLNGGFDGDEAKKTRADAVAVQLTEKVAPSAAAVVEVLEGLPFGGRVQFMLQAVVPSPHRDEVVRGLFQRCFEAGGGGSGDGGSETETDDDFVVIGCGSATALNNARSFVLRVLMVVLPLCGALAVRLFADYEQTTSSSFRRPLLAIMVSCRDFADEALMEAYGRSVPAEQTAIVDACKSTPFRAGFLSTLFAQSGDRALLPFALPETTARCLLPPHATEASRQGVPYANWRLHADTYLKVLEGQLVAHATDPVQKGKVFREFEQNIAGRLDTAHVASLVALCVKHQPRVFDPKLGTGALLGGRAQENALVEHLTNLSDTGKLPPAPGLLHVAFPSAKLLKMLTGKAELLGRCLVPSDDAASGYVYRPGYEHLCGELLAVSGPQTKSFLAVCELATKVVAAASPADFWLRVLRVSGDVSADTAAVKECKSASLRVLTQFHGVLATALGRRGLRNRDAARFTNTLLATYESFSGFARVHDTLVAADTATTLPAGARGEAAAACAWLADFRSLVHGPIAMMLAKVATVRRYNDRSAVRSGITSYAGMVSVYLDAEEKARATAAAGCAAAAAAAEAGGVALRLLTEDCAFAQQALPLARVVEFLPVAGGCVVGPGEARVRDAAVRLYSRALVSAARLLCVYDVDSPAYVSADGAAALGSPAAGNGAQAILAAVAQHAAKVGGGLGDALMEYVEAFLKAVQLPREVRLLQFVTRPVAGAGDGALQVMPCSVSTHDALTEKGAAALEKFLAELGALKLVHGCRRDEEADALAQRAWKALKHLRYKDGPKVVNSGVSIADTVNGGVTAASDTVVVRYIAHCAALREAVLAGEEETALAVWNACAKRQHTAPTPSKEPWRAAWVDMKKMGLAPKAFALYNKEAKERDAQPACARTFLVATDAIADAESPYRELLVGDTRGKDMHERLAAHVRLLTAADVVLDEAWLSVARDVTSWVQTLRFVAGRIKNEAGLVRPQVYEHLRRVLPRVVSASLRQETEEAALCVARDVSAVLQEMLVDDVSKRDSVAKNTFVAYAKSIVKQALEGTQGAAAALEPARPGVRQAWVEGAVALQWTVDKKLQGEYAWAEYCWPLAGVTAARAVGDVRPTALVEAAARNAGEAAGVAMQQVLNAGRNAPRAASAPLRAGEGAAVLMAALEAVRVARLKESPETRTTVLGAGLVSLLPARPDFVMPAPAFQRVEALVAYCGAEWPQAAATVERFVADAATLMAEARSGNAKKETRVANLALCMGLLRKLTAALDAGLSERVAHLSSKLRRVASGVPHYELPAVRALQEAALAEAVDLVERNTAQSLAGAYESAAVGRQLDFAGLSAAETATLVVSVPNLLRADRRTAEHRDVEAMRLLAAATHLLFNVSVSALHLPWVQATLVKERDDILDRYIGTPEGDYWGVFRAKPHAHAKADTELSLYLKPSDVSLLNSGCARRHSEGYLKAGLSGGDSTDARAAAISQYVASPSTSHTDITALLAGFVSESGVLSDENKALVEAVVLAVFSTDSAWHVLAFLLTPSVIEKYPQRVTASVLNKMCAWALPHRVVSVLGLLLGPSRRKAVGVQLHKQILRMMCERPSQEAGALLRAEWANREANGMHKDVVHELVRQCLLALFSRDRRVPAAASDAAAGQKEDEATAAAAEMRAVAWTVVEEAVDPSSGVHPEILSLVAATKWEPTPRSDRAAYSMGSLAAGFLSNMGAEPTVEERKEVAALGGQADGAVVFTGTVVYRRNKRTEECPSHPEGNAAVKADCERMRAVLRRLGERDSLVGWASVARQHLFDWRGAMGLVEMSSLDALEAVVLSRLPAATRVSLTMTNGGANASYNPVVYRRTPFTEGWRVAEALEAYTSLVGRAILSEAACPDTYTDVQRGGTSSLWAVADKSPAAAHARRFLQRVYVDYLGTTRLEADRWQYLSLVLTGLLQGLRACSPRLLEKLTLNMRFLIEYEKEVAVAVKL